jgi:hypothetical protein
MKNGTIALEGEINPASQGNLRSRQLQLGHFEGRLVGQSGSVESAHPPKIQQPPFPTKSSQAQLC